MREENSTGQTTICPHGRCTYGSDGECDCAQPQPQTTAIQEARKQALLDAADLLRGWVQAFGDYVPLPDLIPANVWATDAMNDCIDQIEKMAAEAQNVPT